MSSGTNKQRLDQNNAKIQQLTQALNRKVIGEGNYEAVKGLADGTLTEFVASDYGVTSLKSRRFYNFTNLQKLDLTGVTNIPEYTAQSCTGLTELMLDPNTTNIGGHAFEGLNNANLYLDLVVFNNPTVRVYAFHNSNVKSIQGNLGNIENYAFNKTDTQTKYLQKLNVKINGNIGGNAFQGRGYVDEFSLDKSSIVTRLGDYCFENLGFYRTNPENNVFVFDFRNSTFDNVPQSAFSTNQIGSSRIRYFDIYFPSTLTSISGNAFRYSDHYNIYYKSIPTLSAVSAFMNSNNFKNFFPYNLVQTAKNSTNWSSTQYGIVDSIYGCAEENEFSLGDTLPDTDADGYALTWYSDREMTNQVTTVTDPTQIYYCQVGNKIKVKLSIAQYQATLTVSDGVNTYTNGDVVPVGANITLTAIGQGSNTQPYMFTLNGTTIASGDTYTVTTDDIDIKCIYWDGVNKPFETVFADNTPQQIKVAVDTGVHRTLWAIGDTKTIILADGRQMTLRYTDGVANRYEKVDGSGYSNAVFELVELPTTTYVIDIMMEDDNKISQVASLMFELFTQEWQSIISEIKAKHAQKSTQGTIVTTNYKTFIPSGQEIFGDSFSQVYDEGCTQFDYYRANNTDASRIKKYNDTNTKWRTRSPDKNWTYYYIDVATSGAYTQSSANENCGVPVFFAI